MKVALMCLAIWLAAVSMSAGLAWDEPLNVVKYANIQYYGTSATAANGNTLISWSENVEGTRMLCVRLFSADLQPLMGQPLMIASPQPNLCKMVSTAAGDFIFTAARADGMYAYKLSNAGTLLWGEAGVYLYSWNSGFLEVGADASGGAWFAQYHEQNQYSAVQHVDVNGGRLMPLDGMLLEPESVVTYLPGVQGLPDDGAIVCYLSGTVLKAKRLTSTGETVWANTSLATGVGSGYRICAFPDNTCAISWWTDAGLWMQRYDYAGNAQWPSPLCVITGIGENTSRTRLFPASDGSVFITGQLWYEPIVLQKVSPSGELLFGTGTILPEYTTLFAADANGGCYAGTANGDIRAYRINSSGEHQWGVNGLPVCVDPVKQENLSLHFSSGSLTLMWMDWREGDSGVYCQKVWPDGVFQYQDLGLGIHTGAYAQITNLRVHAMQESSVLVWAQRPQNDGRWQLRMQIVQPDGTPQFAEGGLPVTDLCLDAGNPLPAGLIVTPNQQIMLSWYDGIAQQCKAQLFSSSGNPLWATPSVTVNGNTNSSIVSWLEGGFVFVWRKQLPNGANRLFGQRIVNGVNQWPAEGLQLVGDDPLNPNFSVGVWGLCGDYLIWERGQIWCLRFATDGSPAPGFDPWGLQVSQTQAPYNTGSFGYRALGGNLYVNWYESYLMMPSFDYWAYHYGQQVVSPDGAFLIPPPGIVYADEGDAWVHFEFDAGVGTDCFITGRKSNIAYSMRKYSQTGSLLAAWDCDVYDPPHTFWQVDYIRGLESGKIMLLGEYYTADTDLFSYLVADPQGPGENPPVTVVFAHPAGYIKSLELSSEGESFHLAAAVACSQAGPVSSIYLQKIIDPGSPGDDPALPVSALVSIGRPMPNPFQGSVSFDCALARDAHTDIAIYNLRGQKVRVLYNGVLPKGGTRFSWDGRDDESRPVASGVYILRASSGGQHFCQKLLKLD